MGKGKGGGHVTDLGDKRVCTLQALGGLDPG